MTRRLAALVGAALMLAAPATVSAAPRVTLGGAVLDVAAPAAGTGVAMTALTTGGVALELVVVTDLDGVTRVLEQDGAGDLAAGSDGVAASPDACSDDKHAFPEQGRFRWTTPWVWRFRASSTPDGMSKASAEAQLRAAVRSITAARNDCGLPDRVSARATYLGRTTRKPGVTGKALCSSTDHNNIVGFATLPPTIAGVTCAWFTVPARGIGRAIEADVVLNREQAWAPRRATCSGNEVILRSVATHEFGHVFGLGHVRETTHGRLTMSQAIGPCDDSAFTLGKGDIIGLERLY